MRRPFVRPAKGPGARTRPILLRLVYLPCTAVAFMDSALLTGHTGTILAETRPNEFLEGGAHLILRLVVGGSSAYGNASSLSLLSSRMIRRRVGLGLVDSVRKLGT